jgi:hypothetical protein
VHVQPLIVNREKLPANARARAERTALCRESKKNTSDSVLNQVLHFRPLLYQAQIHQVGQDGLLGDQVHVVVVDPGLQMLVHALAGLVNRGVNLPWG